MKISRSSVLHSFVWNFLEKCSVQLITFAVTIILARLLSPDDYGTIALIAIFIALSNVIIDGGLNTALVQKKGADSVDFSTIFYVSFALSLVLYATLFFCAPLIAAFYNKMELVKVIRILSLSLLFYALNSIQRAYVYKNMLFNELFKCSLISVLISGGVGVLLAYTGFGIWALVVQNILQIFCNSLMMLFFVKWYPRLVFSTNSFVSLFKFGWKIFFTNFIITLFLKIRSLVIGKIFSPSTLAYYDKGQQFPSLIMDNVCSSIQTVLFPAFSEVQDDRFLIKSMMRRSITTSCFLMFPLMTGLIACAPSLVLLLLTEKWLPCVPFLRILCLANFFRPISIPNAQAITAMGYSNITLRLEIIRKVIDVTILLISCQLGVVAIAWGVVIFNFLCLFINLIPNVKLLNYSIGNQVRDILPSFVAALFMGGIVWSVVLLHLQPIFEILLQIVIGAISYFCIAKLFKIEPFVYIEDMIKSKLNDR